MTVLTIGEALQRTTTYLQGKGIERPRLEAEVMLAHLLGMERIQLYVHFDRPLNKEETDAYRRLVVERGKRVPLAYLLGQKEFFGRKFRVTPAVLIPRPETEVLVEESLRRLEAMAAGGRELLVVDVGTGSGVLAVTVACHLPQARVLAIDLSAEALLVAEENARTYHVAEKITFLEGDLLKPLVGLGVEGRVDAVLSNPPYIPSEEIPSLMPEVSQHEPRLALDGGPDGLAVYRRLIPEAVPFLRPGGFLACEIGAEQGRAVAGLFRQVPDYDEVGLRQDYAGRDRVVVGRKKEGPA